MDEQRPTRPFAICKADAVVCPRCGRIMSFNTSIPSDGRLLVRCERRPGSAARPCRARAYVVGLIPGVCAVVPVSIGEWAELAAGQVGAIDVLRQLGVLVEPVRLEAVA